MDGQDWEPVSVGRGVGRRPAATSGGAGGSRSTSSVIAAKLDASNAPTRSKLLSADSVRTIQDYRRGHTMTQEQLNRLCSFPPNTIKKLEGRTGAPEIGQLQTLNRVLKVGLTLE
jgi:ribosome-binding protein aMBF1 (putative translation factor)